MRSSVPRRLVASLAAGVAITLAVVGAQQPSTQNLPTFRTGVDVLPLDVTVLDHDRRPVRGLSSADFHVLIDGEERPIVAFESVDMPDRVRTGARWLQEVPPDVSTNGFVPDRVIVLFLDDFHTSRSAEGAVMVRKIASAVIDGLGPSDLVGIVYPMMTQRGVDFTTDKVKLRAAVERFTVVSTGGTDGRTGMCMRNECVLDVMRAVAEVARAWPDRRKLLVYISPEGQYQIGNYDADGNSSNTTVDMTPALMNTFRELQRSNVTVYQFDPRGLETVGGALGAIGMFADHTGGFTVMRTNDPWLRVPQMFAENDSYYMLGVSMPGTRSPSGFHRVRVRVDRPGLTVRTRNGYYDPARERAAPPASLTALDRAMSGPVPLADLPLSVAATAFRAPSGGRAVVAVAGGVSGGGAVADDQIVDLVVRAFDERSQMRLSRGAWNSRVRLQPQASALGAVHYDTLTRLDLPPGSYEIRLSMQRATDKAAGGVTTSIVIPDFDRDRLSVSGIVLGRLPDATLERGQTLVDVLPFAPTTRRSFAGAEAISALLRVYQGGRDPLRPASLEIRIINDEDAVVATTTKPLPPEAFAGPERAAECKFPLPVSQLAAGEYLLTMKATIERRTAEPRPVRFRIRK
jgi:VWFA-related protein